MATVGPDQLGGDVTTTEATRVTIFKAQHDDGGWAETDDRQSNAYLTGETLFILCQTGTPLSETAV